MGDITRTKANVRPLAGSIIRKGTAGGTIEAGEAVYLNGTSGWAVTDSDAAATALARGIMVSPEDAASGDTIDICVFGPVEGYSAMTPGALHYISPNTGEIATTAGTKSMIIGWAETATILFVSPSMAADPT